MGLLIQLVIVLCLLALGFFAGGFTERRHFKRLERREAENRGVAVTQLKSFVGGVAEGSAPQVFIGEAVISSDYLKSFLGKIRQFFGGEMRSYQSLLERARREALLRVVEQAKQAGCDAVCNVRYETADIAGATNPKKGVVLVAIIAAATAYRRPPAA